MIGCDKCQHQRGLRVADFLVTYNGEHRIASVVKRLKCSTCGAAPAKVLIKSRLHDVVLVGQGAFG